MLFVIGGIDMGRIPIKKCKNKSGAALVIVLVTLVVVSIFCAIVANITQANLLQAKAQEKSLKAYYLALSGSDLCFASLLQKGPGGDNDTLLYKEYSTTEKPDILNTRQLSDHLTLDGGTVNIDVKAIVVNGERWVEIKSVATLDASTVTKTTTLQFQVSNPMVQKKS